MQQQPPAGKPLANIANAIAHTSTPEEIAKLRQVERERLEALGYVTKALNGNGSATQPTAAVSNYDLYPAAYPAILQAKIYAVKSGQAIPTPTDALANAAREVADALKRLARLQLSPDNQNMLDEMQQTALQGQPIHQYLMQILPELQGGLNAVAIDPRGNAALREVAEALKKVLDLMRLDLGVADLAAKQQLMVAIAQIEKITNAPVSIVSSRPNKPLPVVPGVAKPLPPLPVKAVPVDEPDNTPLVPIPNGYRNSPPTLGRLQALYFQYSANTCIYPLTYPFKSSTYEKIRECKGITSLATKYEVCNINSESIAQGFHLKLAGIGPLISTKRRHDAIFASEIQAQEFVNSIVFDLDQFLNLFIAYSNRKNIHQCYRLAFLVNNIVVESHHTTDIYNQTLLVPEYRWPIYLFCRFLCGLKDYQQRFDLMPEIYIKMFAIAMLTSDIQSLAELANDMLLTLVLVDFFNKIVNKSDLTPPNWRNALYDNINLITMLAANFLLASNLEVTNPKYEAFKSCLNYVNTLRFSREDNWYLNLGGAFLCNQDLKDLDLSYCRLHSAHFDGSVVKKLTNSDVCYATFTCLNWTAAAIEFKAQFGRVEAIYDIAAYGGQEKFTWNQYVLKNVKQYKWADLRSAEADDLEGLYFTRYGHIRIADLLDNSMHNFIKNEDFDPYYQIYKFALISHGDRTSKFKTRRDFLRFEHDTNVNAFTMAEISPISLPTICTYWKNTQQRKNAAFITQQPI